MFHCGFPLSCKGPCSPLLGMRIRTNPTQIRVPKMRTYFCANPNVERSRKILNVSILYIEGERQCIEIDQAQCISESGLSSIFWSTQSARLCGPIPLKMISCAGPKNPGLGCKRFLESIYCVITSIMRRKKYMLGTNII